MTEMPQNNYPTTEGTMTQPRGDVLCGHRTKDRGGRVLVCLAVMLGMFLFAAVAPTVVAAAVAARPGVDPEPSRYTERYVVIKAGKVITVSGEEIDRGEIVIVDGVIQLVGRSLEYPATATVIEARGQTVVPGFVLARSRYGLEPSRRRGVHGSQVAADEVELDRLDFRPLLEAGVTAVAFIPDGTGIPGLASVIRTGGSAEDRVIRRDGPLRVPFNKAELRQALRQANAEIEKVERARKAWDEEQEKKRQAEAEKAKETPGPQPSGGGRPAASPDSPQPEQPKPAEAPAKPAEFVPPAINPDLLPLVNLLRGERRSPAMIEVRTAADILHLYDLLKEPVGDRKEPIPHILFIDVPSQSNLHMVLDTLAEHKPRVLITPDVVRVLQTVIRFNAVAEIAKAGCEVSIVPNRLDGWRSQLGELVRSGLDRKTAIAATTINPVRALGIERTLGTIEKGKAGDLVFLDADPTDPTARTMRVMILGETVWEREGPMVGERARREGR